jgi:signal transduction histidine kinase
MSDKKVKHLIHDLGNKLTLVHKNIREIAKRDQSQEVQSCLLALDRCFESIHEYHKSRVEDSFEILDIHQVLIEGSIPHYEKLEKIYGIEIDITVDRELMGKQGNVNLIELKKIRENIVDNAVKAGANKITISYSNEGDYVLAKFIDNGQAIGDELISEINNYDPILDDSEDITSLGTKIIKEACVQHGFNLSYKRENDKTVILFVCPYYLP